MPDDEGTTEVIKKWTGTPDPNRDDMVRGLKKADKRVRELEETQPKEPQSRFIAEDGSWTIGIDYGGESYSATVETPVEVDDDGKVTKTGPSKVDLMPKPMVQRPSRGCHQVASVKTQDDGITARAWPPGGPDAYIGAWEDLDDNRAVRMLHHHTGLPGEHHCVAAAGANGGHTRDEQKDHADQVIRHRLKIWRHQEQLGQVLRRAGGGASVWDEEMAPLKGAACSNLRKARKASGHTLGELSRLLGTSVAYVSDVERGLRITDSAEVRTWMAACGSRPHLDALAAAVAMAVMAEVARKDRPQEDIITIAVKGAAWRTTPVLPTDCSDWIWVEIAKFLFPEQPDDCRAAVEIMVRAWHDGLRGSSTINFERDYTSPPGFSLACTVLEEEGEGHYTEQIAR